QGGANRLLSPHRIFAVGNGVSAKPMRVERRAKARSVTTSSRFDEESRRVPLPPRTPENNRPIVNQFTAPGSTCRSLAACPGMKKPRQRDGGDKEHVS